MMKTLSDEEMLNHFNAAVSEAVGTATALQDEIPHIDPIKVQIGKGYGMNTAHLFLCHALRKAQEFSPAIPPSTVMKLIAEFRSIYSLPNAPKSALNELGSCLKSLSPPGKAFTLPQLLWCIFPEALSWSKDFHDAVDMDYLLGTGETTLVTGQLNAAVQLLDSLGNLPAVHLAKYQSASAQRKFYRDHLVHPLRVAWLMETLLINWGWLYERSAKDKLRQTYDTLSSGVRFPSDWPGSVNSVGRDQSRLGSCGRAASLSAALFHDMCAGTAGSCSSSENDLNSLSRRVNPFLDYKFARYDLEWKLGMGFMADLGPKVETRELVVQAVEQLHESSRARPTNTQWKAAIEGSQTDHGVRVATELTHLQPEARQAMALHNLFDNNVATIDLFEAPVAFFLVLCDEAQEWGRWVPVSDPGKYSVLVKKGVLEIDERCFHVTFDFSGINNNALAVPFDFGRLVADKEKNLRRLTIPNALDLSISYSLKDISGKPATISWRQDTGWKSE